MELIFSGMYTIYYVIFASSVVDCLWNAVGVYNNKLFHQSIACIVIKTRLYIAIAVENNKTKIVHIICITQMAKHSYSYKYDVLVARYSLSRL